MTLLPGWLKMSPLMIRWAWLRLFPLRVTPGLSCTLITLAILTEQDLTGRAGANTRDMRKLAAKRKKGIDPLTLRIGDFAVHSQHGIGKFLGIETRTTGKGEDRVQRDYLVIEYQPRGVVNPGITSMFRQLRWTRFRPTPGQMLPSHSRWVGLTGQRLAEGPQGGHGDRRGASTLRGTCKGGRVRFRLDTPWQRELEDAFFEQ